MREVTSIPRAKANRWRPTQAEGGGIKPTVRPPHATGPAGGSTRRQGNWHDWLIWGDRHRWNLGRPGDCGRVLDKPRIGLSRSHDPIGNLLSHSSAPSIGIRLAGEIRDVVLQLARCWIAHHPLPADDPGRYDVAGREVRRGVVPP